jgi:hypothetical protein
MQVVAHQHIGMDLHLLLSRLDLQQFKQALVVGGVAKNVLPIVAAQDDMVRVVREGEAGQASHGGMLSPLIGKPLAPARRTHKPRLTNLACLNICMP